MNSRIEKMTSEERRQRIIQLLSRAFLRLYYRGSLTTSDPESCLDVSSEIDLNVPMGERSPGESDITNKTSRQGAVTPSRLLPQTPFKSERDAHG